jgi:hypothetical protein
MSGWNDAITPVANISSDPKMTRSRSSVTRSPSEASWRGMLGFSHRAAPLDGMVVGTGDFNARIAATGCEGLPYRR